MDWISYAYLTFWHSERKAVANKYSVGLPWEQGKRVECSWSPVDNSPSCGPIGAGATSMDDSKETGMPEMSNGGRGVPYDRRCREDSSPEHQTSDTSTRPSKLDNNLLSDCKHSEIQAVSSFLPQLHCKNRGRKSRVCQKWKRQQPEAMGQRRDRRPKATRNGHLDRPRMESLTRSRH